MSESDDSELGKYICIKCGEKDDWICGYDFDYHCEYCIYGYKENIQTDFQALKDIKNECKLALTKLYKVIEPRFVDKKIINGFNNFINCLDKKINELGREILMNENYEKNNEK